MIVLSCLINASGVGRTEKIYNIFGSKKDLIIESLSVTSQKYKFVKLWDLAPFSNRASLKRVLAKNYLLIVIPSRNIKDGNLILPHTNLSNFESVPN